MIVFNALVLSSALTSTACAIRPLPGRDWESPIHLYLNDQSLKDQRVQLTCGTKRQWHELRPKRDAMCDAIDQDLQLLGAQVQNLTDGEQGEGASPYDLSVEYATYPKESEGCGLYALVTFATSGLFPCSSLDHTSSEIKITNAQGATLTHHRMVQNTRRIYGSTGLLWSVSGLAKEEQNEAQIRLREFIQNRVYTASLLNESRHASHEAQLGGRP